MLAPGDDSGAGGDLPRPGWGRWGGLLRDGERALSRPPWHRGSSPNEGEPLPDAARDLPDPAGGLSASRGLRGGGSDGSDGPAAVAGGGGDPRGRGGVRPPAALGEAAAVVVASLHPPAPARASGEALGCFLPVYTTADVGVAVGYPGAGTHAGACTVTNANRNARRSARHSKPAFTALDAR